ncbi:serine hydrolase domain-containing protein [Pseudonocardia bannensis]|uniref:Beta-lactamase family protein n=1 Tax=Pseudonocardia bannensis TaxID=630973 RepID=A0A848DCL0_9PSEU|nr:serine hydrolase domain-containing protein [Pseudonocardia bannensis]NMH90331.1 beta-lactamase family protein [Pseudonocardia bannensis]
MSSSIDQVLQNAVDSGAVPNAVAVAADRDGVIYEGAAGPREAGGGEPVTADSHFRIMSMTKMVATAAALQQMEKGNLDLDAPIDTYCPEFADIQVLEGFDGDTPKLRPPASRATVKQLVTHTAGLGYWFWNENLVRWEAATGTPNVLSGSNVIFTAPLVADPGTRYIYGINTDWLGKVVEAASGTTLDVAIKEGITGPLGMDQTAFLMNAEQRANSVPVHLKGEDGTWSPSEIDLNQDPEYFAGGHGLYSTPRDYLKFQRALLGGGTLDGTQILQRSTVDAAFTNQIGDLDFPAEIPTADPTATHDFNAGPGYKWGYGLLLNTQDVPGMRKAGSGAWAGLCNTHFWVDPTTGVTGAIYTQFLPFVPQEALDVYADFERALYASL